jgi:cytochrome c553
VNPATPLTGGLEFAMGPIATTWSANLTPDPETGIGRWSDAELARTIRHGVLPNGQLSLMMSISAAKPSDHDISAILGYLRSLPPLRNEVATGHWGPVGKLMLPMVKLGPHDDPAPAHVARGAEPSVERGRYLSDHVALCTVCHGGFDMATFRPVGPKGAGSAPDPSHGKDADMEFVAPNLTSEPSGRTGQWTEDFFVQRIREGRRYKSSIMPWESFKVADEVDLRSIYRYLKSLPPVSNDLGPSYRKKGWKTGDPVPTGGVP